MKVVYKIELTMTGFPMQVAIPEQAKIVHIEQQYPADEMIVSVWFEIEQGQDHDPNVGRTLCVYGTGHPIPTDAIYLSTHILHGGALVLHVYELVVDAEDTP